MGRDWQAGGLRSALFSGAWETSLIEHSERGCDPGHLESSAFQQHANHQGWRSGGYLSAFPEIDLVLALLRVRRSISNLLCCAQETGDN